MDGKSSTFKVASTAFYGVVDKVEKFLLKNSEDFWETLKNVSFYYLVVFGEVPNHLGERPAELELGVDVSVQTLVEFLGTDQACKHLLQLCIGFRQKQKSNTMAIHLTNNYHLVMYYYIVQKDICKRSFHVQCF